MQGMRAPAVAGAFYPGDAEELRQMILGYVDSASKGKAPKLPKGRLRGIIVPHAGYVYSGPVAAYAYRLLKGIDIPERIVLLGPSHYAAFPGLVESGYSSWQTPLGEIDAFSIRDKQNEALLNVYPPAHDPEHSLEVQLPFLQLMLGAKPFKIDPILTGEVGPGQGASAISRGIEDAFLVVSSDLSHYLPYPDAVAKDNKTLSILASLDPDRFSKEGDACGRTGISIALALAKSKGWSVKLLKYANSGDTAGEKSEVVGYAALAIMES